MSTIDVFSDGFAWKNRLKIPASGLGGFGLHIWFSQYELGVVL